MSKHTCPRRNEGYGYGHENEDTWRPSHLDAGGRVCSFCGGLHPAEFIERVERGEQLIPTDKNYKAYIGPDNQKVYFQHLDQAQRDRLIELHNAGKISFDYPGYWYRLPYFARRITDDDGHRSSGD